MIALAESYVVLDKPAGTSVGGTTDNIEESCATFASRALGFTAPLLTTHQIDNCTEGCVVFARSKEYCSSFHKKIRDKKVKKLYLALSASPVPIGVVTHYMRPVNVAPRLVSEDFIEGWHLCQLEVIECKEVPWPNSATEERYCLEDCGWPSKDHAYECKINLLTGRTHQVI
uniref:RNA pseudouridine synthase 6ic isoform X2 n=1 Tax=Rhizophora mucronata TaxID=61149 RepID=A0A2P2JFQ7_RHIMU